MDCTRLKGIPIFESLTVRAWAKEERVHSRISISSKPTVSHLLEFQGLCRFHEYKSTARHRLQKLVTLASAQSNESDCRSVGIPLKLRTPEGEFLCGVLKDQPHTFLAAAEKLLDELAFARDGALTRWKLSEGSSESCLHRRISDIKDQECQLAVEEIMYMLIVYNFSKINVPMIPNLSICFTNSRQDILSSKEKELESIYGTGLLEMVRENISNILRLHGKSSAAENWTMIKMKRLQLGRLYATSIMFGYFLKSVSQRHNLDLSLSSNSEEFFTHQLRRPLHQNFQKEHDNLVRSGCSTTRRRETAKLRDYMAGFDSNMLRLCSKLRSHEAKNLVENHSWALFENPGSGYLDEDEDVALLVSVLKRLILEAVAFGTFFWDVEWYVDFRYGLKSKD